MTVKIEIECETTQELLSHLGVISETIKIKSRFDMKNEFEVGVHFEDNNCYGTHDVIITPQD